MGETSKASLIDVRVFFLSLGIDFSGIFLHGTVPSEPSMADQSREKYGEAAKPIADFGVRRQRRRVIVLRSCHRLQFSCRYRLLDRYTAYGTPRVAS